MQELYSEILETLEVCHDYLESSSSSSSMSLEDALGAAFKADNSYGIQPLERTPSGRVRKGERDRQLDDIIDHIAPESGDIFRTRDVVEVAKDIGDCTNDSDRNSYYTKLRERGKAGEGIEKVEGSDGTYRKL